MATLDHFVAYDFVYTSCDLHVILCMSCDLHMTSCDLHVILHREFISVSIKPAMQLSYVTIILVYRFGTVQGHHMLRGNDD